MQGAAKLFLQLGPDVSELDSPPRSVQEAGLRSYGGQKSKPGWSLDFTVDDQDTGQPWDLSSGNIRQKFSELIKNGKLFMIICSPMCTAFAPIKKSGELDEAKGHVRLRASLT